MQKGTSHPGAACALAAILILAPAGARADAPVGLANPDFEKGLQGWTATANAFAGQPSSGEIIPAVRASPLKVGGDYWRDVPFPIGVHGSGWITTSSGSAGDTAVGTLTSDSFKIPAGTLFISFLIGGGEDPDMLHVDLLSAGGGTYAAVPGVPGKTGLESELLRRDWWDVSKLDQTKEYAIRITDVAATARQVPGAFGLRMLLMRHLNVDDIRFEKTDPSTAVVNGHPYVLRTTIANRAVWTDYDAPLWGSADLHTHPMSYLSMGKRVIHGGVDIGSLIPAGTQKLGGGCNPSDKRAASADEALGDCSATHGGWGSDNSCGNTIRSMAINIAFDSEFANKIPLPHEAKCAAGLEMDAGLCYPSCPQGFVGHGPSCYPVCTAGWVDTGFHCTKPLSGPYGPYDRGVGYTNLPDIHTKSSVGRGNGYSWDPFKPDPFKDGGARCRNDFHQCDDNGSPSIFYPTCPAGFFGVGPVCWEVCAAGYHDDGATCRRDGVDIARDRCAHDNPQGCEQQAATFYPNCKAGFKSFGCCVCTPECPANTTDIGASCQKNLRDRGVGKPPLSNMLGDHQHAGYPMLAYWPHYTSTSHQQMYVDWIQRAHDGGLNVLVALATNSELFAAVVGGDPPSDDKASIDLQIDEMHAFIARHDFMREAKTPADLRAAIKSGKLAVIIGVEADNIGDFNYNNPTLSGDVNAAKQEIQRLYQKGVRYIFPLHLADNVFGGAAVFSAFFNLSNRFARTRPLPIGVALPPNFLYAVESAPDPFLTYRLSLLGDVWYLHALTAVINTVGKPTLDAIAQTPYPPAFNLGTCPIRRCRACRSSSC